MRIRATLSSIAVIAILGPACSAAQTSSIAQTPTTPVAIENTNSTFIPTTDVVPAADPARPTISSPALIPPTGYLQFEQGFAQSDASPAGVSAQPSINQVTKIALTTRLMVQLLSQPYTYNVVDNPPTIPAGPSSETRSSAPGDLDLGVQFIFHKSVGALPTLALGYAYRVRAGTAANIDLGDFVQTVQLLMSGDLPHHFHYDANVIVNQQNSSENSAVATPYNIRRAQFAEIFAVSHPLFNHATGGRLSGAAELSTFTQPFLTTTSAGLPVTRANTLGLLFAASYALRPNIVLDAAFYRGLTSTSTQWEGAVGITYLLPHRLWPDRHPVALPVGPYRYARP
jgi:hypothetical protein